MLMLPIGPCGLKVVRVTSNGRRYYDRAGKARLIEACLEPGVSVAALALQHGVNANQLRRWVMKRRQGSTPRLPDPSAFVRVEASLARAAGPGSEIAGNAAELMSSARLQASLPNGVSLTLERCDVQLLAVMIDALGRV
jgi:transposase